MSLDVTLRLPRNGKLSAPDECRIYVRRAGRVVEITRAEWDEIFPGREPALIPSDEGVVFEYNITHNLGKMAVEAGLYDAMWRPDEHGMKYARDLIAPLKEGLAELVYEPGRFRDLNPPNGWGNYDDLVMFAATYLAACLKWPHAEVRVSR